MCKAQRRRDLAHPRLIGRGGADDDRSALLEPMRAVAAQGDRYVDVVGDDHSAFAVVDGDGCEKSKIDTSPNVPTGAFLYFEPIASVEILDERNIVFPRDRAQSSHCAGWPLLLLATIARVRSEIAASTFSGTIVPDQ